MPGSLATGRITIVVQAFEGCYGVFLVTDLVSCAGDRLREEQHGKNASDAAKQVTSLCSMACAACKNSICVPVTISLQWTALQAHRRHASVW